jgi:hypothetical protein
VWRLAFKRGTSGSPKSGHLFPTAHLNHSVSQHELPRLVNAVWPSDDVQGGWVQVPLGSAGGSNRPASNLVPNARISDQV